MSSIVMCDGCGAISNQMASKVIVYPAADVQLAATMMTQAGGKPVRTNQVPNEYIGNGIEKDYCEDCTRKILEPKVLKVLEQQSEGKL